VDDSAGIRSGAAAGRLKAHRLSDTDLILAMQQDAPFAFIEFIDRFRHVAWHEARGLGVDASSRKSWSEEVLHNCALALTRRGSITPKNLAGYIIVAVRRQFVADRRKMLREDELVAAYNAELSDEGDAGARLPEPLVRLAENLASQLGEDDEALLEWKRRKLGYTQAAVWLGVKRDTVAHRTLRLTARLQKAALQFLETLSDDELRIIRRFVGDSKRGDK